MGWAGITVLVYAAVMALLTVLPGGLLRDPQTHSLLNSPFMDGIIFFMMLLFLLPGLAYGIGAGTLKNSRDAVALVNKSISGLAGFMVLIFFAAQPVLTIPTWAPLFPSKGRISSNPWGLRDFL